MSKLFTLSVRTQLYNGGYGADYALLLSYIALAQAFT